MDINVQGNDVLYNDFPKFKLQKGFKKKHAMIKLIPKR